MKSVGTSQLLMMALVVGTVVLLHGGLGDALLLVCTAVLLVLAWILTRRSESREPHSRVHRF